MHAGAELEPGEVGQPRQDLDPPAEVLGPAGRGPDPEVQRRARAEPRLEASQRVVQQRGAGRTVVLEARPRAAGREQQVERRAPGVRRHQHGLVVDRDDPLAPAHLLLHVVAEQVPAHRAHGVGAEALTLAGDRGGDEVQRVQLRVRVRERGSGLPALVDDQVLAGGVRVRSHALAPGVDGEEHLLGRQRREVRDRLGRVDDHLVPAGRGLGGGEVRVGVALRRLRLGVSAGYLFATRGPATGCRRCRARRRLILVAGGERVRAGSIGASGGTANTAFGRSARAPAMIVFSPVRGSTRTSASTQSR